MNAAILCIPWMILVIGYFVYTDRRHERMQRLRVKKMLASPMFQELGGLLRRNRRLTLESVRIDKTGVKIRYVYPLGTELRYKLHEHGYANLTDEKTEALALLIEECLPALASHKHYKLKCKRERLINGSVEHRYQYVIRNAYKNTVIWAPYYDGTSYLTARNAQL